MKFLHIVPPSRRMMDTYMRMLRDHFNADEHHFYFIDKCPKSEMELFEYGNVQEMTGNGKWQKMQHLSRALKSADLVIWHGFLLPARFMLFLAAQPKVLKKSVWLAWGIDLYNWKREGKGIKPRIVNALNLYCRQHIKAMITLLETDKQYFEEHFSKKIPCFVIPYPISEVAFAAMDIYKNWKPRRNGVTYVQVAHNAHTFNRHLNILESLLPYKDENMRLFLPMSYGNDWHTSSPAYGKEVAAYANEYFPGKAQILYRLMPQLKYTEFLWNMDVSIFNAERQNALGNILKLLYMGNKVFLTSDGPLYKFFKDKGIEIFDTKEIGTITYEEFVKPTQNTKAIQWITETYHPKNTVLKWKSFLEEMAGKPVEFKEKKYNTELEGLSTNAHVPEYKPNYLGIVRYLGVKKLNVNQMTNAVIVGAGTNGVQVAQWLFDSNRIKNRWLIKGFLDNKIESLCGAVHAFDVIGRWNEWMKEPYDRVFFALETPQEKRKAVEYFEQTYWPQTSDSLCEDETVQPKLPPIGELVHSTALVSTLSTRGKGCLIGPYTFIDVQVQLGDFINILNTYVGPRTHIGSFCNIGSGCHIGTDVEIDEGITIRSGSFVPDGSHITQDI